MDNVSYNVTPYPTAVEILDARLVVKIDGRVLADLQRGDQLEVVVIEPDSGERISSAKIVVQDVSFPLIYDRGEVIGSTRKHTAKQVT